MACGRQCGEECFLCVSCQYGFIAFNTITHLSRDPPQSKSPPSWPSGTFSTYYSIVAIEVLLILSSGCLELTQLELCSPQSILLLIEELLDSQSIEGCRNVFNFLESRREAIIAVRSKQILL